MQRLGEKANYFRALKERQNLPRLQRGRDDAVGSRRFTSGYLLRAASRPKAISRRALLLEPAILDVIRESFTANGHPLDQKASGAACTPNWRGFCAIMPKARNFTTKP